MQPLSRINDLRDQDFNFKILLKLLQLFKIKSQESFFLKKYFYKQKYLIINFRIFHFSGSSLQS